MRHKAVHEVEWELNEYTEEDGNIDRVNIDFINCNAKSPGIIAKLINSSYQNVSTFHTIKTEAVIAIFYHFVNTKFYS